MFDVLKKQKWAYDANQPASKFLPNSNKTLMDDIEQKANKLSDRVKRELLDLFYKKDNHDKIEKVSFNNCLGHNFGFLQKNLVFKKATQKKRTSCSYKK